ncbi:MAG: Tripartite-type tricarboxylate transporter, receptor component TctC [Hyphomicrobiales bacterium]|nr:Tripartite-type tricarboxylate transporter, receptor component TctC [Hyphomicrobiales bacterium]
MTKRGARWALTLIAGALCGALASGARAQTPEAFYAGKDVRILFGAGVGGTYSLYAQLAVRHMRQHIPGKPSLVMQSMPGAGGLVALNYSYAVAPRDGTLMHLMHAEVLYETLLTKDVKFNAQRYGWIGRFADADSIALATRRSGVRSLEDAKAREVTMGATGGANIYALAPIMLNRMAGTKFRIIGGYKGASDIYIAMERGEVDASGMTLANAVSLHADKLKSGELAPVFAISAKRLPDYPGTPAMTEFGGGTEKALLEIYASAGTIGRALAFPPGVAPDRLEAMREAFRKTIADPAFLAETAKANVLVTPMEGAQLAAEIDRIMKTPEADIAAARALHEELATPK